MVLIDSEYGLTFIDNSRLWPGYPHTVLNVVASDFRTLSNLNPGEQLYAILDELHQYISFDSNTDLYGDLTHFQPNIGAELFINEVGSEQWRPRTRMDNIANVFLAGDYCKTVIDVVTVEGAVVSGLEAAEAVRIKSIEDGKLHPGDRRVRPIDIKRPESYSPLEMLALKAMLAPSAWAAMCMSWLIGQGGQAGLNAADSGGSAAPRATIRRGRSRQWEG